MHRDAPSIGWVETRLTLSLTLTAVNQKYIAIVLACLRNLEIVELLLVPNSYLDLNLHPLSHCYIRSGQSGRLLYMKAKTDFKTNLFHFQSGCCNVICRHRDNNSIKRWFSVCEGVYIFHVWMFFVFKYIFLLLQ